MSVPRPKKSLSGRCSAVHEDTLYVLSPNAFQSLPLKENATWSTLPQGEAVTGPACVTAIPNGDQSQAALYVIGGTSSNDSYGGMQRFFFKNQSWETLTPLTPDMKGRTDHSVAYLNDSASILVYAGSQPQASAALSSQTFLISATEPYDISAFTSTAPPANQPVLLQWDSGHAVMLGGERDNKQIFTFGPEGWEELGTNLTSALPSNAGATLISGTDGSKVLQVYDASKSPNEVENIVLLGAGGKTAKNGQTIGTESSRKRKRDLTLQNWPEYNSTDAPKTQRSDYTVAQSSDGLAIISGGDDSNPVAIFNQKENTWVDASTFFNGSPKQVPLTSSTSSATPTSTMPPSTTSDAAAATSTEPVGLKKSTSSHTRRTLGITLGVLAGVALLMAIALLYMRKRKNKKKQQSAYIDEKDADRLSFADRGASFMKEAGGSVADLDRMAPPKLHHFQNDSQSSLAIFGVKNTGASQNPSRMDSRSPTVVEPLAPPKIFNNDESSGHNSLMIIAGKFGANRHSRGTGQKGSFESTARLVRSPSAEAKKSPVLELEEITSSAWSPAPGVQSGDHSNQFAPNANAVLPQPANDPSSLDVKKRSSGWSKYFAPAENTGYQPTHQNSSNLSVSQYTVPSRMASSLNVPPLDIGLHNDLEAQRLSAVAKGRPSYQHSNEDLAARGASLDSVRPQTAAFHTGNSLEPDSYLNDRDSFTSENRRHSTDSIGSHRIASSIFFNGGEGISNVSGWHGMAAKPVVRGDSTSAIKEIHIPPSNSPRIQQLQRGESMGGFARPPSSTYSASIAPGRDSRLPPSADDLPGRALSPPIRGPTTVQIPGPAARAAMKGTNNSGFFPSNKDASRLPPRKVGALHPGTLAAISYSGINTDELVIKSRIKRVDPDSENRDSNLTVWPSADDGLDKGVTLKYLQEQERLKREKETQKTGPNFQREQMERQAREMREKEIQEGTGSGNSVMSGYSEYSWLNLGAQK
ncbi:hypothetical protein AAFC00_005493 [Neodothiora populina]|uniref:Pre-mRNA splicing factor CLF1 n=1 Tax=Neodothiora populina TaxID=2781224 RepID=A0ABR3PL27_9PEZI